MTSEVMGMGNYIYTIGRELGSGGYTVAKLLAERLGIKLYDKELLAQAAKDSGFCEEIFENHDERPTNSFLYSLVMDTYTGGNYSAAPFLDMPLNHKVFLAQFETIKKIAEKESCVIVGRCADYILRDNPDCLSFFIHNNKENRIQRIIESQNLTVEQAEELMLKTDKSRAAYYNYYTNKEWGVASTYNFSIDVSVLGIDETVAFMKNFVERKMDKRPPHFG